MIEDKTKEIEQVITSIPKQPSSDSNITLPRKTPEDKPAQIAENQQRTTTNAPKAQLADQTTKKTDQESKQIALKIEDKSILNKQESDIPKTTEDLIEKYNQAQKLIRNGKYTEALATFSTLAQTSVSHRYIIGNSYFWMGICYKALRQPAKALESFKKVTAQNSYKEKETNNEIKALQRKTGK